MAGHLLRGRWWICLGNLHENLQAGQLLSLSVNQPLALQSLIQGLVATWVHGQFSQTVHVCLIGRLEQILMMDEQVCTFFCTYFQPLHLNRCGPFIAFPQAGRNRFLHILLQICLHVCTDILPTAESRPTDLSARYGGEAFALVLPNTSPGGARLEMAGRPGNALVSPIVVDDSASH